MKMRGNLGFVSEMARRSQNGDSIYARGAGTTVSTKPLAAPVASVAPVAAKGPPVTTSLPGGITVLPPPIPHLTGDRYHVIPSAVRDSSTTAAPRLAPTVLRVSPTAGSSGGGGSGGAGVPETAETAAAKPGLPIGLLGLLAYLFMS